MINVIHQHLLNRFKARGLFLVLCTLLLPAMVLAAPTITSVTVSTANPAPGSVLGVTVVYCEPAANTNDYFDVALEPSADSTLQDCPLPGQHLLVDGDNTAGPASPLVSTLNESNDLAQGWNAKGPNFAASGTCATNSVTQVFNVTIPVTMTVGSYNIVAAAGQWDIQCSGLGNVQTQGYAPININFSSLTPSLTITKSSIGDSAQVGDLVQWQIGYTAINDTPITITDTIPSNTALAGSSPYLASISPGGTLSGSTITWVVNTTSAPTGDVWFLTTVTSNPGSGYLNNTGTASSSLGTTTSNAVSVQVGGDFQLTK
jgi:hypothetical protein